MSALVSGEFFSSLPQFLPHTSFPLIIYVMPATHLLCKSLIKLIQVRHAENKGEMVEHCSNSEI